ncbi:hypothetical protein LAV_00078 [Sphingobium phage Lacusarx]|uniref:Uncharacterized protein n=1 Tax=Sphingobium phage Lacusarx TaxID=1980139 RepID=A0A1W6DX35_9CAUD|nr:hypothetical protein FDH44_gp078 [Sphingobium phage Lacusarx]ARK07478.1 hypothetical protein LAV_00078 [Sphingobium phage Lacusarx]
MPRGLSPLQCNDIERSGTIPPECSFMNPTLHFCDKWRGALIDETDPEFDRCRCNGVKRASTDPI